MGRSTATARALEIARTFDAPRNVVFTAWTDADQLKAWFGPKGFPITECALDFRVGGTFRYRMRTPDGGDMWGKWEFQEIKPPQHLVFVVAFSDETGVTTRHPGHAEWPLEILSEVEFTENSGRTTITVRCTAVDPTDSERRTFEEGLDSMREGWTGTFEQLDELIVPK